MPAKNSAEYMREYRANRKKEQPPAPAAGSSKDDRVAELEEEVRQLKRRLAEKPQPTLETNPRPRPQVGASSDRQAWPTFGFSRPAPKPSKSK